MEDQLVFVDSHCTSYRVPKFTQAPKVRKAGKNSQKTAGDVFISSNRTVIRKAKSSEGLTPLNPLSKRFQVEIGKRKSKKYRAQILQNRLLTSTHSTKKARFESEKAEIEKQTAEIEKKIAQAKLDQEKLKFHNLNVISHICKHGKHHRPFNMHQPPVSTGPFHQNDSLTSNLNWTQPSAESTFTFNGDPSTLSMAP